MKMKTNRFLNIVAVVAALFSGCATSAKNYRIPKNSFDAQVKIIAVIPIEDVFSPNMVQYIFPVTGTPMKNYSTVKGTTQEKKQVLSSKLEILLMESLKHSGFAVVNPIQCEQVKQQVYKENKIVTSYDVAALRFDDSLRTRIWNEYIRAVPADAIILASFQPVMVTINRSKASWDGATERTLNSAAWTMEGRGRAISLVLAVLDKERNPLWTGQGGVKYLNDNVDFEAVYTDELVDRAVRIAIASLKKQ
jgi:hypothetical protein